MTTALLFILQAAVLLGSPGPGIAALVTVGRRKGFVGSLPFFAGLQLGLAVAVVFSAAGLFTVIGQSRLLTTLLSLAGCGYLLFLAWSMATAPVGEGIADEGARELQPLGGFLLGVTNPKAYLAFVALMASTAILPAKTADLTLKSALIMGVIVIVDLTWLWAGGALKRLGLTPPKERTLNIAMGAAVALAAVHSLASLNWRIDLPA